MSDPTYTPAQIQSYLQHISFPTLTIPVPTPVTAKTKDIGLPYLTALQRYHLATVPFENISLHYSTHKRLSLADEDLFEKIVIRKRGGYCMELNQFFGTILRSLGFDVVSTGGRVCKGDGKTGGWNHQLSLVSMDETIYLVDVGFGSRCPTRPLPLIHEHTCSWGSTLASNRLIYQPPTNPIVQGQWVLQHRISPKSTSSSQESQEWSSLYTFTLTQFHPADFAIMNLSTSTSPDAIFTQKIVAVRMLLDERMEDIEGMVALEGARLKRRVGDANGEEGRKVRWCKDENQRVVELEQWFGIVLVEEERMGIKGGRGELMLDEGEREEGGVFE